MSLLLPVAVCSALHSSWAILPTCGVLGLERHRRNLRAASDGCKAALLLQCCLRAVGVLLATGSVWQTMAVRGVCLFATQRPIGND